MVFFGGLFSVLSSAFVILISTFRLTEFSKKFHLGDFMVNKDEFAMITIKRSIPSL